MRLHSNAIDTAAGGLQLAHQTDCALTLRRVVHSVVVVVEFAVRVSLVSELERHLDIIGADNAVELRRTQLTVVEKCLIHNVPALDFAFVARHHSGNVLLHTADKFLFCNLLAQIVLKEPVRQLRVPNKAMARNSLTVALRQLDKSIGIAPVVKVLFGVNLLRFHTVFRHKRAELVANDTLDFRVIAFHLTDIDRRTQQKLAVKCLTHSGFAVVGAVALRRKVALLIAGIVTAANKSRRNSRNR